MANKQQKLIADVLDFLEILPVAEKGSLEEQFRESVFLLCVNLKKSSPDETQLVPREFFG